MCAYPVHLNVSVHIRSMESLKTGLHRPDMHTPKINGPDMHTKQQLSTHNNNRIRMSP
ncbi:hypothetical protein D2E25_0938 [Bifidobacterium goeldii]|uniref:Uncharacterized protein n=1 Tax=Bifidobacterium goeldii TaxID=2306975 RepID=A0A430FL31_9BIFI|nr:hypothetical protein D2E25_0938 [Bifidobacterium goeldii]